MASRKIRLRLKTQFILRKSDFALFILQFNTNSIFTQVPSNAAPSLSHSPTL